MSAVIVNAGSTPVFTREHPRHASHEQPGARQQHDRQRDLDDDEPAPHRAPLGAAALAAVLERVLQPGRDMMSAGTSPNASAVMAATAVAKINTGASMPIASARGMRTGDATMSAFTLSTATTSPTVGAATASTTLSVRKSLTRRPRLAPMAARSATSRRRSSRVRAGGSRH